MRKVSTALIFIIYSAFTLIGDRLSLQMQDSNNTKLILENIFLFHVNSGLSITKLTDFNYLSYTLLFGFCFLASFLISRQTYNIAKKYMSMLILKYKSKKMYIVILMKESIIYALIIIVAAIIGFAMSIALLNLSFNIFDAKFILAIIAIAVNYLLFFIGLSLFNFMLKIKQGATFTLTITTFIFLVLPLVEYEISLFSILTIGTVSNILIGFIINMIWTIGNIYYTFSEIKKIDLV
jgi:hypothetical protein